MAISSGNTSTGEEETEDPWDLLASQLSLIMEFHVQGYRVSKLRLTAIEDDTQCQSLAYIYTQKHKNRHTHIHMYADLHRHAHAHAHTHPMYKPHTYTHTHTPHL